MRDERKTKAQLISELAELRQRVAELQRSVPAGEALEAGEALRQSERLFHSLIESLPQNVFSKDLEGRFTFANQRYCTTEGKSLTDILGKTDFDLHPPELAKKYREDDRRVIETGQIFETVEEHQPIDGERYYVQVVKTPVYDSKGQVAGILGIFWDITERRQAEAEIRKLGQFLDSVIESANVWLNVLDEKGKVVLWNRAAEEISGYSREEVLGHDKIWGWLYPEEEYRNQVFAKAVAIIEGGRAEEGAETSIQCKDGQTRIISWHSQRLVDEKGNSMGSVALGRDITERKQAESRRDAALSQRDAALEELRESEHFLDTIVENIPNMIFVKGGEDLRFVRFNKAGEELLGYTREELIGKNDFDFFPREEAEFFVSKDRAVLESGELLDIPDEAVQTRYKGERILHTKKIPIAGAGGKPLLLGISEDITEWKRAEAQREAALEALRESEQFLQSVFDAIQDGISVLDTDLNVIRTNRWMEQMYAHQMPLAGRKCYQVYQQRGSACPWCPTLQTIKTGKVHTEIVPYPSADDPTGWIELSAFPLKDEQGHVTSVIEYIKDITERVRAGEELRESNRRLEETLAELEATQEQIVQQERLAAVGQLAAGVAHDFNNLLTSIMGYAELVQVRPDIPPTAQADLARIVKQGQRAAHLVRQILDFSRKTIRQPQTINLVPFLKEAVKFLERTIPESIHIRLEIEPLECLIQADPTQLQQMVTNLAVNARDAMPAGGELKLRLSSLMLRPGEPPPCPELPPGEWIVLSVSDTGTGIPAEIMPHIFEPFFTTRAPEGSGLGLAQVYGIVKQHEGAIDVESEVGKGTTFSIYLPALAVGEKAAGEEAAGEIPRSRGETVLLVEDEPVVLEVGQALLEHLGYRVLTAVDGQQALEVYAEHQAEIALILADIVMPKMDGLTLFHVLKAQSPDVKVVLITGYPLGEEAQRVLDQGIADWLEKPMTLTRLAQVVSQALRH